MAQVINTNIASLTAQRNLAASQKDAATAMQRLSSGLRINSAKDDAAGLAISNRLTSQINGINQAIRNANDGLSVAQVAEGALAETTSILQRMRELSVQSANASNSSADRTALQTEVTQLKAEIDRIANNTAFGTTKLLNGSFTSQNFQVGANVGETIGVSMSSSRSADIGQVNSLALAGFESELTPDPTDATSIVAAQTLTFTVDGTSTTVSVDADASAKTIAADISSQVSGIEASAITGVRLEDNGSTFNATTVVTVNGVSLGALDSSSEANFYAAIKTAIDGNDQLNASLTVTNLGTGANQGILITDADGDDISVAIGAETGTSAVALDVVSQDSSVTTAASDANTSATTLTTGETSVVTGAISFTTSAATTSTITASSTGNLVTGTATSTITDSGDRISDVDISTVSGANSALSLIDAALTTIDSQRATLGAVQSRFDSVISNLSNVAENSSAARSRIMDADFAAETAQLAKTQILQQAGISVLAQANAQPQNVLALLQ